MWKKEGKEPLYLRELKFRESHEIPRQGVHRLCSEEHSPGGLVYSTKKGRFEASAWKGHTSVQHHGPPAPSPVAAVPRAQWRKGHEMTAPKINSIIQKI